MSPSPQRVRTQRLPARRVGRSLWRRARAAGFWTAVLAPLAYPAVVLASAWTTGSRTLLIGVLCVHVLALAAGRGHNPEVSD